ncbi:MAG: ComEC/Rec2 family competence protein, partial [Pseudomonadota bacterium]
MPLQAALFLAGVIAVLLCPWQLPGAMLLPLAVAVACAFCRRALLPVAFLGAGALLAQFAVQAHFAGLQRTEQRLLAEVRILGIPRLTATGMQFDGEVRALRQPLLPVKRARLIWRSPGTTLPRAGDRWQFALRLLPPGAHSNPDAVDLARNALRDHVQATGTVLDSPLNRRMAGAAHSLDAIRERIAERIMSTVSDPASAALLAALGVGATGDVSRESWRVFNATGITHLVAISGLHVTLFAMLAMAGTRRLWAVLARLGLHCRREPFAAWAGMLLATGYALLAGFSVPTQRTLLMLGVWLLWRCAGRAASGTATVAVAAIVVLLWDPFSVLAAGFWLSFVAVCAIIWIAGGRPQQPGKVQAALLVQFAVTIALLPVTFAIFGSLSLAG